MSNHYSNEGTVLKIENNIVTVTICAASACSGCHAKGACSGLDHSMKNIDVKTNQKFSIGEKVTVSISQKNSIFALFLGYLLPFILIMITLIAIKLANGSDIMMASSSLLVVCAYYLVLFQFKSKLSKQFSFVISKINV